MEPEQMKHVAERFKTGALSRRDKALLDQIERTLKAHVGRSWSLGTWAYEPFMLMLRLSGAKIDPDEDASEGSEENEVDLDPFDDLDDEDNDEDIVDDLDADYAWLEDDLYDDEPEGGEA